MQESFTFEYEPRPEAERWLPVARWEDLYEVSSLGKVRSLPRRRSPGRRGFKGRTLKPCRSRPSGSGR